MQKRHPEQSSLLPNLPHLLQPEKKSLESRPGFHSAKLGHKHIHNLSGISSSSITRNTVSFVYSWVVVKPAKRTRYQALKTPKQEAAQESKLLQYNYPNGLMPNLRAQIIEGKHTSSVYTVTYSWNNVTVV